MAQFDYDDASLTAVGLIGEFGKTISFTQIAPNPSATAWAPGEVRTTVSATAVILPVSKSNDDRLFPGVLIGDELRYVIMAALHEGADVAAPKALDELTFDSADWSVLAATTLKPADVPVLYRIGVRRL